MATTHFPSLRTRWVQALPLVVAGSAVTAVVAWSRDEASVAGAMLAPGVLAVALGARAERRRERRSHEDRVDAPPHFHPASHDLAIGVLQRTAFDLRLRRPDGWTAVAMFIAESGRDHAWVTRVVARAPAGVELGLLADGRLGALFDAQTRVAETVAALSRAAGPDVRVGLSIGGIGEDAVEALRAADGQCRRGIAAGPAAVVAVAGGARTPGPAALAATATAAVRSESGDQPGGQLGVQEELVIDLRGDIGADLRNAIEQGELEVRFQPVIDLTKGTVRAMEALARWTHAADGPISPEVFIPLAEKTGSIQPLTELVLGRALDACASWHAAGSPVRVAVNISSHCLSSPRFPGMVAKALAVRGVEPGWLTLEITEGHAIAEDAVSARVLAEVNALGVRLSIDDFGTGYSSFAQLLRLTVDEVKIDRSFVARCLDSVTEAAVVRSVIELAERLGIEVVAEGVEDVETRDHLARLGCDSMQGFLTSYPLAPEEAAAWLLARQPSVVQTRR